jgi:hypothetical protein
MSIKSFFSRAFNKDTSGAKRAACSGLAFITHRGKPAHAQMTFQEYQRNTMGPRSIVNLLVMHADVDFEPPKLETLSRQVNLIL